MSMLLVLVKLVRLGKHSSILTIQDLHQFLFHSAQSSE